MADTHETIADIIAEKRRRADELEASSYRPHQFLRERIAELRQEAARLEAAHRRERGDAAKLREALEKIHTIAKTFIDATKMRRVTDSARLDVSNIKDLADAALATLSAPPRNCDVGTVEEQSRRFDQVCSFRFTGNCAGCKNPLDDSAANGVSDCALFWAQMPYKEGGAK